MSTTSVVIGGGAAGIFFAALRASNYPEERVILLEKTNTLLSKVRISGGGRCNVTHACFVPEDLVKNYPRGSKELLGPFYRFQPKDTIQWFMKRGVQLKTEEDGRMFPVTDNSETIINCLLHEARASGVDIRLQQGIASIEKTDNGFNIIFKDQTTLPCARLLLATGSNKDGYEFARKFGHTIVEPVPSLFTFNIPQSPLHDLSGISVDPVRLTLPGSRLNTQGPLLITHWGFSGPAALKLSAWGARVLHGCNYKTTLHVNWLPDLSGEELTALFIDWKREKAMQSIGQTNPESIAKQLWRSLLLKIDQDPICKWKDMPHKTISKLAGLLQKDSYLVDGKTTYKQEFVTSGGILLNEINFKTMESKVCKGLYFAGEILDIDGVTGGFNFQNAWTTAWIAASS